MKTSVKMLIVIAAAFGIAFLIQLLIVRTDLREYLQRSEKEKYKTIAVDSFRTIHVSPNWTIRIRQGKQFKVQLDIADTAHHPSISNTGGTLYLRANEALGDTPIHAKIITPSLSAIYGERNSIINVEDFNSDTLTVTINDGCVFSGRDNNFKNVSIKTKGDAHIGLTDIPNM